MTPLQPKPDLEVPAIVRKVRRPRTPPLRRPMVMRALLLVALTCGVGAATVYSSPTVGNEPIVSMRLAEPKPARLTRLTEASLQQ